jgi:hypothetical protein
VGKHGWVHLCQDCWQERNPDDYLPADPWDVDYCEACKAFALLYADRPSAPEHFIDHSAQNQNGFAPRENS